MLDSEVYFIKEFSDSIKLAFRSTLPLVGLNLSFSFRVSGNLCHVWRRPLRRPRLAVQPTEEREPLKNWPTSNFRKSEIKNSKAPSMKIFCPPSLFIFDEFQVFVFPVFAPNLFSDEICSFFQQVYLLEVRSELLVGDEKFVFSIFPM